VLPQMGALRGSLKVLGFPGVFHELFLLGRSKDRNCEESKFEEEKGVLRLTMNKLGRVAAAAAIGVGAGLIAAWLLAQILRNPRRVVILSVSGVRRRRASKATTLLEVPHGARLGIEP